MTGKNEGERNKCGAMVTNSFLLHVLPLVVEGDYSGPAFQFQSGYLSPWPNSGQAWANITGAGGPPLPLSFLRSPSANFSSRTGQQSKSLPPRRNETSGEQQR